MNPKSFKSPKIHPEDFRMDTQWFVYYSYLNPLTGRFQRFKVCADLNRIKTKKERLAAAQDLKDSLTYLLQGGWNPFDNELPEKEPKDEEKEPTLRELLERALAEKCSGKTRKTEIAYRGKVKLLFQYLEAKKLADEPVTSFRPEHAREVLQLIGEQRGICTYTRNTYLVHFKSLFSLLVDMEVLAANPFGKIKRTKTESESHTPFSANQIADLRKRMQQEEPQLYLFTQFIYYAFIRPNELRLLQVKHVDLANRLIHIPQKAKNGEKLSKTKGRHVEICASLAELITRSKLLERPEEDYLFPGPQGDGEPNGRNTMYNRHLQILKKAGITNGKYTLYGWKHSGVIAAYIAGLDILTIQQMCGHSTVDMTYRYLRKIGLLRSDAAREKRW